MRRYYLHICNGVPVRDETGAMYVDLDAARSSAIRGISELIAASIVAGDKVHLSHSVIIEDGDHQVVDTVKFGDLFVA